MEGQHAPTPDHAKSRAHRGLMSLPTELHTLIASYLSYPDALALKHTSFKFNSLVYTGVHLKVDWLVERFERKLECPMEKCSFRTDEQFCNWRIRRIMERRRWHLECRQVPGGCCVVDGQTCRKVLIPWLKRSGPRKVTTRLSLWGREALIICIIAFLMEFAWNMVQRTYDEDKRSNSPLTYFAMKLPDRYRFT
ncbi:hypothetical protein N7448_007659 [Penicillium atrosanguineum]|uniref:Uncharacterized protein n=1 Tax=Penicillium atrosanguineum TaxID=1132637 RepID=A0A9W9GPP8_9EURO|nr:uncharacterized protein N7443_001317 [Penicillium atrosanguineum]KAJ5126880.1 hypothetical protein N7448_007659 [Penicillium atrosanguineum]KAJ5147087.1 hypothetical protein N7526_000439 [Penicillium atrosanguineum]KAJ5314433.1 hypothetical protein N7443_001317 [Penicillium atrosanguineum]KAJ5331603.1 hypothetical protein N7476_001386 [Penicillium atrosanguineum]